MGKIILAFLLITSCILPQEISSHNIFELKNLANQNSASENIIIFNDSFQKKNAGLAVLYSLLLPGMGELYAGSYSSGKYFTIAEGSLWGIYFGMNSYSNWLKNNYKSFAAYNGSVNTSGKNADYYATIGQYMNIEEYNDAMNLERNFNAVYNTGEYYWKWNSPTDRKSYRNMWTGSEHVHNNLRFVVGALILNRLVSAINAVRLVSVYNKSEQTSLSWNLSVGIPAQYASPDGLALNFSAQF